MLFQTKINMRFIVMAAALFSSLFIVSCEDDHGHDEAHIDAEGFILENSDGVEVYREFKGAQTGSINLSVNDTLELAVHFLGDDGKELGHDHEGEEEEAEVAVSGFNSSIAIVEVEEHHEEDPGHEEENALEIIGVSAGSTSFKLELMHEGHADYTSTNNVPIVVK